MPAVAPLKRARAALAATASLWGCRGAAPTVALWLLRRSAVRPSCRKVPRAQAPASSLQNRFSGFSLDDAAQMCHELAAFNGPKDRGRSKLPAWF